MPKQMRSIIKTSVSIVLLAILLVGCLTENNENRVYVSLFEGETSSSVEIVQGTTVDQLLGSQLISLGPLDRVTPSLSTTLTGGESIRVIRGEEEFSITESVLPFEQQTVKNESLPEGQSIFIQSGVNGLSQTTYRILIEDGVEVSRTIMNTEIVQPPKPEILMIGVQSPFSAISIDGVIAYISASNAWVMETSTGNRKAIVSTGDLDGRIFSLSPDREWLLFSRSDSDTTDEKINSLWIVNITKDEPQPVDTKILNVVHYADWVPGKKRMIAYSTVESRTTAPGWQANNDLLFYQFDEDGKLLDESTLVESNSGGLYGWWGTMYHWSPDGSRLAYARPDSFGLVDLKNGDLTTLVEFAPYQPKTDWAWIPWLTWSDDNNVLYTVIKSNPSDSFSYDLTALLMDDRKLLPLASSSGLFSYPVLSPVNENGSALIGYLSTIIPEQIETSRYNLFIMDRDGSNRKKIYPGEGLQGLDPQIINWSPGPDENGNYWIAFIAQGNLLIANIKEGAIRQVTGDGSITKISWR